MVLRSQPAVEGRPGARLATIDFDRVTADVARQIGRTPSADETLSYVMYPDVFTKFARAQQSYGNLGVLPTKPFFYGMQTGQQMAVEIEACRRSSFAS